MDHPHAAFDEMSREASLALLERNHLGRIAFTLHDRVDVEPISYVSRGGWIYVRTSPGHKVATVLHHPWVAFQVDEVHGRYDWQSVVVRGSIHLLNPTDNRVEAQAYDAALATIRAFDPDALTPNDPTPQRSHLLRMHVAELSGRVATMSNG